MKGALLLLEKNGLLVRTSFTNPGTVQWFEGEVGIHALQSQGFKQLEQDLVSRSLIKLHNIRDALCQGRKVTNSDLLDVIRLLEEY